MSKMLSCTIFVFKLSISGSEVKAGGNPYFTLLMFLMKTADLLINSMSSLIDYYWPQKQCWSLNIIKDAFIHTPITWMTS